MYQAVLADAKFLEQLLVFDRDLAASTRAARCWRCGGALHSASYERKPRGCADGLGQEYAERFSFCCAVDGCRKRTTPPSLRFLGRKIYLATVVTLISAMLHGTTPARLARLSAAHRRCALSDGRRQPAEDAHRRPLVRALTVGFKVFRRRGWRSEADLGCMSAGQSCASR